MTIWYLMVFYIYQWTREYVGSSDKITYCIKEKYKKRKKKKNIYFLVQILFLDEGGLLYIKEKKTPHLSMVKYWNENLITEMKRETSKLRGLNLTLQFYREITNAMYTLKTR